VGIILAILYHEDTPYEIARKQTRYLTARITSRSLEEIKYLSLPPKVKVETLEELESVVRDLEPSSMADTQPVRTILPTNPQTRERSFTEPIVGTRQRTDQWPEEIPSRKKINVRKAPSVGDGRQNEYELKPGTITLDGASHDRYDTISTKPRAIQLDRQFAMDVPTPGSVHRKSDFMRPPSDQKLSPEHRFRRDVRTSGGFEPSRQASGWDEPRHAPDRAAKNQAGGRSRQLYYACLLIPRFVSTPIQGEVRNILAEEMANICISNGWRLESVQIDKDSLQWVVLLPANISPARHIKIIRELTSNLVLPYFSNVNRDGLLKDFWAPGHLLESGSEPILSEEIEEFIAENRAQYYSGQDYPRTGR
jgi:hypothetical protein